MNNDTGLVATQEVAEVAQEVSALVQESATPMQESAAPAQETGVSTTQLVVPQKPLEWWSAESFENVVFEPYFIIFVILAFGIGVLAGCQVGRYRKIGSKRPKFTTTAGMVEIYVGNLSYETDEDQLRKEFEKFGTVYSSRIISNHFSHKSKGFGFIEMPNRPEAEAAIKALNDAEIQGRKLRVNEARNKPL